MQNYIRDTIKKDAKIKYDSSVKQWIGVLHHESGSIYAQQKAKPALLKEMGEILEEFLVRFFQQKAKRNFSITHRDATYATQVPRTHLQA